MATRGVFKIINECIKEKAINERKLAKEKGLSQEQADEIYADIMKCITPIRPDESDKPDSDLEKYTGLSKELSKQMQDEMMNNIIKDNQAHNKRSNEIISGLNLGYQTKKVTFGIAAYGDLKKCNWDINTTYIDVKIDGDTLIIFDKNNNELSTWCLSDKKLGIYASLDMTTYEHVLRLM